MLRTRVVGSIAALALTTGVMAIAPAAPVSAAVSTSAPVIINEVYGGGNATGAPFRRDFIELVNTTGAPIDLTGYSIQYKSATGTWGAGGKLDLTGPIPANGTYLIGAGAVAGTVGAALPATQASYPAVSASDLSATSGNVALVDTTTLLTCVTTACQSDSTVVDLVAYGSGDAAAGTAAAAPSNTTSISRDHLHTNTVNNLFDFMPVIPTPGVLPTAPVPTVRTIAQIQGTGTASPLAGQVVTTSGVVTAVYPLGGFYGYVIQTAGTGGDSDITARTASDGLFVYSPATVAGLFVGRAVTVSGYVVENSTLTQLNVIAGGLTVTSLNAPLPPAIVAPWPGTDAAREKIESMLYQPPGSFTVTNNFNTNSFGEVALATGTTPLMQPTDVADAGSAEAAAVVTLNAARLVTLDDGASTAFLVNQTVSPPYFSAAEPLRVGALATFNKPVVIDFRNSLWKFQPQQRVTASTPAGNRTTFANTRVGNSVPDLNVDPATEVSVASFNVLNYFTTLGAGDVDCTSFNDRLGDGVTVSGGCEQRGAWDPADLTRQQDKIVAAINSLDAAVVGLMEIENSVVLGETADEATDTLVNALNSAAMYTKWAYVPSSSELPSPSLMDVITNAIIYQPALVDLVGASRALGTDSDPAEAFDNAREPIGQVFVPDNGSIADRFLVVVNHFKSKSSGTGAANADLGDGQGASNYDRVRQADALAAWVPTVQSSTAGGVNDVYLIGDFNAYTFEDPLQRLYAAGYHDANLEVGGNAEQSYSFSGLNGSLDHILANGSARARIHDSDIWTINGPEQIAFEYSRFNYHPAMYYDATSFRSSDHDPVLVSISKTPATVPSGSVTLTVLDINDFHGRIDANTLKFAGTIEQQRELAGPDNTLFLAAGDNIGASVFDSAIADDDPTIEVLNALGMDASAVGNHELDQGFPDLRDDVIGGTPGPAADWDYLAANIYDENGVPVLDEYTIITLQGIKVGVIGAITSETPTLVRPGGIAGLTFGEPVAAVNRVAAQLKDGDPGNGEADVIIATFHEGASEGLAEGATLEEEVAAGAAFARIVTELSPLVSAILTGHTHKEYAWDAPVPGQPGTFRPIIQTGNYGERIGRVTLTIDTATKQVTAYTVKNVLRTTANDATLTAIYPRVADVKVIVDAALANGVTVGNVAKGSIDASITRAFTGGTYTGPGGTYTGGSTDDRSKESTLGDLVADALKSTLSDPLLGGAEIGVVNPGGLRADLTVPDTTITYREANNVLPFVNNLWTVTLTGAQFKTLLEQQWQRLADGSIPARPYLQLGLSSNVTYTFDSTLPEGSRITSITVNGAPINPSGNYRIGTFSFLVEGGDNFFVFKQGTNKADSGLVDRDGWISYIEANPGLDPDFARQAVEVKPLPTAVAAGSNVVFTASQLNLTSAGSPSNTTAAVAIGGVSLGDVAVSAAGVANVDLPVPAGVPSGAQLLTMTVSPSGTVVTIPVTVAGVVVPPATPDSLTPITPARVFDTRPGESPNALRAVAKAKVGGDTVLTVKMTDLGTLVPASGVGAVALNVTVTNTTSSGFITVYSCGERKLVSSANYVSGQTVANTVVVPVSADGNVCFYSSQPVDLIADVSGWFATGAGFTAVNPDRVFDTRPGESPAALRSVAKVKVYADTIVKVKVTDLAGLVPATGVGAVSLNLTATDGSPAGFVTVYPCGPRGLVSNLNFAINQTVANAVLTPVSADGEVCFYSSQPVDLIADINGWFTPAAFAAVNPARVFDTRAGESPDALRTVAKAQIGGTNVLVVKLTDLGTLVPATGVGAVSLTVTATNGATAGFVTAFPCGDLPVVSNLNFAAGQTVANAVIAPVSADGNVCFYSSQPVDLVADVNGYFPS